jgi:hypothetical protein
MPYAAFNNFKYGLDGRRSELSSVPGALLQATDGHITQGGAFEQRKAFTRVLNGSSAQSNLPANTYGLETTATGLVVFGSAAPTTVDSASAAVAGTTLYSLPTYSGTPPLYYQRCVHPSDSTKTMSAVLCSSSFNGNTWAAVQFNNNDIFLYYDGTAIPASYNGKVLTSKTTNAAIAAQLYAFINTSYFQGQGIYANYTAGNNYVDIYSSASTTYTTTSAVTSTAGTLTPTVISSGTNAVAAISSTASFNLIAGGVGQVKNIYVSTDNGATWGVDLLGGAITWQADATGTVAGSTTATAVAAQIDTVVTSLNCTAQSNGNLVNLQLGGALGATPNGYPLKLVTSTDVCIDNIVLDFTSASAPSSVGFAMTSLKLPALTSYLPDTSGAQTYNSSGSVTITLPAAGLYFWQKNGNDTSISGTFTSSSSASPMTSSGWFQVTSALTVTLNGFASSPVTAIISPLVEILTASGSYTGTTLATWVTNIATQVRAYCLANSLKYNAYASGTKLYLSRAEINTKLSWPAALFTTITNTSGSPTYPVSGTGTTSTVSGILLLSASATTASISSKQAASGITFNISSQYGAAPITWSGSPTIQGNSNWQLTSSGTNATLTFKTTTPIGALGGLGATFTQTVVATDANKVTSNLTFTVIVTS